MSNTDNTIYVDVNIHCARKDKDYPVRTTLEEAGRLVSEAKAKTARATALSQQLAESRDALPDLVIVYKGQHVVLGNVHSSSDDAVKRALNAAIGTEAFIVPEARPRKKSETADAKSEA